MLKNAKNVLHQERIGLLLIVSLLVVSIFFLALMDDTQPSAEIAIEQFAGLEGCEPGSLELHSYEWSYLNGVWGNRYYVYCPARDMKVYYNQ